MSLLFYILGIFFLSLLLLLFLLLLLPFRIAINASYSEKKPAAKMDCYWIKYFLGFRCSIEDLQKLNICLWIFAIPIPFKLSLDKIKKSGQLSAEQPAYAKEKKTEKTKKRLSEYMQKFSLLKKEYREKYEVYLKKIFVSYITFTSLSLKVDLGLNDPARTGMLAAIYYFTRVYAIPFDVDFNWDFQDEVFNAYLKTKISMNLFKICLILLQLFFKNKKERKNESRRDALHATG